MFLPSNITLKFGDSGDFVAELQRRLAMVKCFSQDQVNGFYDGATVNGVMAFQGQNGLHADGVAGPETLRRLNGVIAGDTSGGSEDKKEEEAQRQMTETNALNLSLAEQQNILPAAWGEPAPQQETPAAPAPQPVGLDPAMFGQAGVPAGPLPLSEADRADIARHEQMAQAPVQDLSALFMQATPAPAPIEQAPPAPQPAPLAPQPLMAEPPAPLAPPVVAAAATPVAEPLQATAPQQVAEPQGLMQRAGRFANAMVQKLSDYFEAKLPPSVLNEVKAAGQVMAQSGVREAPIPTGPEMGGPSQAPARGPDQQQAQIR